MSVWVWEELVNGTWIPWIDVVCGGRLVVHPTARYIKQPEPHTPQYGRFRWTEYSPRHEQKTVPLGSGKQDRVQCSRCHHNFDMHRHPDGQNGGKCYNLLDGATDARCECPGFV